MGLCGRKNPISCRYLNRLSLPIRPEFFVCSSVSVSVSAPPVPRNENGLEKDVSKPLILLVGLHGLEPWTKGL